MAIFTVVCLRVCRRTGATSPPPHKQYIVHIRLSTRVFSVLSTGETFSIAASGSEGSRVRGRTSRWLWSLMR